MRRQVSDHRDHHHGRDPHHHHHHHHGGGGVDDGGGGGGGGGNGGGGSTTSQQIHHHHHHHHHHRQTNNPHFHHHSVQHRSSSSSQLQHLRPSNHRHRSRTSSLSMGLDGPPPPQPPPPPSSASLSLQPPPLQQQQPSDHRYNDLARIGSATSSTGLSSKLSPPLTSNSSSALNCNPSSSSYRRYLSGSKSGALTNTSSNNSCSLSYGSIISGSSSVIERGVGSGGGGASGTVSLTSSSSVTHIGGANSLSNNFNNNANNLSGTIASNTGGNHSASGTSSTSSSLASPSHTSAVLRKKRLLACIDGPGEDGPNVTPNSGGIGACGNTNSSSRTSLPTPPISNPSLTTMHNLHNGMSNNNNELPSLHSSAAKSQRQQQQQQQQQQHHHHHHHLQHYHHSHLTAHHHHASSHHHNSTSNSLTNNTSYIGNQSSNSSSLSLASLKTSTTTNLHPTQPLISHHNISSHQTKSSSFSSSTSSPLASNHLTSGDTNKASINTNDLRRITSLSAKSGNPNTNSSSINCKREPLQASTPTSYVTHRSSTGSTGNSSNINAANTTTVSSIGPSDKPKKTSSSYLLPNSIYNKAGPGQKSSTLASYTQLISKGDDSRMIDIGSQSINLEIQDPRLTKVQERIGSVLTTITNNEDFSLTTKIHSSLDDQTNLDSIKVTSSELTKRNKLRNPTTSLADSTTHRIDDQSSSEVSSSSDADISKVFHSTTTTVATAVSKTISVSRKPVMNLPLPKFACINNTSESTTLIKKTTPDRELTTVSSSNKLLLNKTPLLSISAARHHLSPSSLASFSAIQPTATVTPTVDYSKFNIRKKTPATSVSSLEHANNVASSINVPSAGTSSDEEKPSPIRRDSDATNQNAMEDFEELSVDKCHSLDADIIESKPTVPISRALSSELVKSLESKSVIVEKKPSADVITKRRISNEKKSSRKSSPIRAEIVETEQKQYQPVSKPATPDISKKSSKSIETKIETKSPSIVVNKIEKMEKPPVKLDKHLVKYEKRVEKCKSPDKVIKSPLEKATVSKPSLEKKSKPDTELKKTKSAVQDTKKIEASIGVRKSESSSTSSDEDASDEDIVTSKRSKPRANKPEDTAKRKLEAKKTRKKFELKLKERLQAKSKDKFKVRSKKRRVDDKPSTKLKNASKRGIKNRVKTKASGKAREKNKQRKSSLFVFDEEPIYLSMYDKVKARSSANQSHTTTVNTTSISSATTNANTTASVTTPTAPITATASASKEATKQQQQRVKKRQSKPTVSRKKANADSDSEAASQSDDENSRDEGVSTSPIKTKTNVSTNVAVKRPRKKNEKRISAKDFELPPPSEIHDKSSNSASSLSSSLSSSSSSSSSSHSSSSSTSFSSSSDEDVDEDAELSAIVAETAGRIGDEMNVIEAANSPQLSPPPSPNIESDYLLAPTEQKASTKVDDLAATSSDTWNNMVNQPLHINLPLVTSHSTTNTPSPRKSGPSDLISSSPSICAKSAIPTPELSPHEDRIPTIPTEVSTLDSRCETERAISTLLMEMDTDSTSEQMGRELSIEIDTRESLSNHSLSPKKSPVKFGSSPKASTSPRRSPILESKENDYREKIPQSPQQVPMEIAILPTPPPPLLTPSSVTTPVPDCTISPVFVPPPPQTPSPKLQVAPQQLEVTNDGKQIVKETVSTDTLAFSKLSESSVGLTSPLQIITAPPSIQIGVPSATTPKESPSSRNNEISSHPAKRASDSQPGKHSFTDEHGTPDDLRADTKRVRRSRKKSMHPHYNSSGNYDPANIIIHTAAGQQAKMSPYDIFEFRDSDDDEATSKTTPSDSSNSQHKSAEASTVLNTSPCASSATPVLSIKPIAPSNPSPSAILLQTVAQAQSVISPITDTLSPKSPLNLRQPVEINQQTPPRPTISPSGSSNENKDPAPKPTVTSQSNQSSNIPSSLLQTVDLKVDILKAVIESPIKLESTEEALEEICDETQRQRDREYVTELSQDGKLSLTIRKASNQAREFTLDSRMPTKTSQFETTSEPEVSPPSAGPPLLSSGDVNQSTGAEPKVSNVPQTPAANIKPTRRSARLMQSATKDKKDSSSTSDDQTTPPKDLTALPQKIAATTSKEPISSASVPTENQPPVSNLAPKEPLQQSISNEALKESQPSAGGDLAEPPVKTRRYARGKKVAIKQQQQISQLVSEQASSQQVPLEQQAISVQQDHQLAPTQIQPTISQHIVPEKQSLPASKNILSTEPLQPIVQPILSAQVPAQIHAQSPIQTSNEPKRPKRLTRLAAKTFGPTLATTTNANQTTTTVTTSDPIVPAPVATMISAPVPPTITEQPNILASSEDLQQNSIIANDENSTFTSTSVIVQPPITTNPTPIMERLPSQPIIESNKSVSFCVPSYLPPRKRLGWFWSQKQLLEQRYLVVWTSRFTLKDSFAAVQMHFISGNNKMPSWSYRAMLDETGMPSPIQIDKRMSLDPDQLEGVQRKMANEEDHCVLLAVPVGRDQSEYAKQSTSLRLGFIDYLSSKKAAGIVSVRHPGESQPSYIIHIFPSCTFVNDHILQCEPDLLSVIQNIDNLIVVITTA